MIDSGFLSDSLKPLRMPAFFVGFLFRFEDTALVLELPEGMYTELPEKKSAKDKQRS